MKKGFSLSTLLLLLLIITICLVALFIFASPSAEAPTAATGESATQDNEEDPGRLDVADTISELAGPPIDTSFEHTAPGEYSEITVRKRGTPGEDIELTVSNDAGYSNSRIATADENGEIVEVFRIFQYGHYHVEARDMQSGFYNYTSITVE